MAELTTTTETTTSSCCAPEAQATCCEQSAKAGCCDPSHGEGCECSAGKGADSHDIRERVRERYAAAAVQVTRTDPGAGCCAPSETFDGGRNPVASCDRPLGRLRGTDRARLGLGSMGRLAQMAGGFRSLRCSSV